MITNQIVATVSAVLIVVLVLAQCSRKERTIGLDAAQGTTTAAIETIPQIADELQRIEQEANTAQSQARTGIVLDRAATERLQSLWR